MPETDSHPPAHGPADAGEKGSPDRVGDATHGVDVLAGFMAQLKYESLPSEVRSRLSTLLLDLFGVTAAGHQTSEMQRLLEHWEPAPGPAPLFGTGVTTDPETATVLNAAAACCLELDEGNKHANGHPALHVVFAALAAAQTSKNVVTGQDFLVAVAAGYEVAARFGASLNRDARWHPHGNSGATGAACAAALIHGLSRDQTAAAIDSSSGLMHVTPWAMVLNGNFTRNFWAGGANIAGLTASRLAGAGLIQNTGSAGSSLGDLVGSLDAATLTRGLGDGWYLEQGYNKIHASCSYTHAAVDVIQDLRKEHRFRSDEVATVEVRTNSLARPLLTRQAYNRLSGMFSLPFVAAVAVLHEAVDSRTMDPSAPEFEEAWRFMNRIDVSVDPDLDRYLPSERWTKVRIQLVDGRYVEGAQPNPVGDTDFFPMDRRQICAKLSKLVGERRAQELSAVVDELPETRDVHTTVMALR